MQVSLRIVANLFVWSCVLLLHRLQVADGVSLADFYPRDVFQDEILQRSTGSEPSYHTMQLTEPANFYGNLYNSITISSNGLIAFGNQIPSFSSGQEPEPFPSTGTPILAPFWAQASYLSDLGGDVLYRRTTASVQLERASGEISAAYNRAGVARDPVVLSALVVVTWNDMRSASDQNSGNTFQCVIAIGPSATYVFFLYADDLMTWTGSPPALVGFNAGDGASSFALPTSRTPAVLAVAEAGNTGSDGKWFFQVDGSDVQMPGILIGWGETELTTPERGRITVCASVFLGAVEREERLDLSFSDITTRSDRPTDYTSRRVDPLTFGPSTNRMQCESLPITVDLIYEIDEQFQITLSSTASNRISLLPRTTTVTIMDDDAVLVTFDPSSTVKEEDGTALFSIMLTGPAGAECETERSVVIDYFTFPGDATEGVDYIGSNGTVTISGGCSARVRVTLLDDNIFEMRENFFFSLSSTQPRVHINSTLPHGEIIITDMDAALVDIGFEQDEYTVREGETVRICAQMSATSGLISVPLVVNIISLTVQRASIAAPQATDGLDLIDVDEGLTFLPGRQNERHCVNITTLTDDVYEGTEVRRIHLVRDPPDVTLDPDVAMIHILDNNGVTVSVERSHYDYREGQNREGSLPICANLTGVIERDLSVSVEFQAGTAKLFDPNTARDGDVDSDIPPIVFDAPIGPATKVCDPVCTACSNVRIRDDLIIEEKFENFSLSLSHSDQAVSLTSTAITVTIEDEDTVEITWADNQPSAISVSEGSEIPPQFAVRRVGFSAVDTSVRVIPRGITATENADFMVNSNVIVIPPSDFNEIVTGRGFISMTLLEDLAVEGNETVELVLESVDPERITVRNSSRPTVLTIVDNDRVSVNFTQSSYSVNEGEEQATVCIQMIGYSTIPLTVTVSTTQGTARVDTDFNTQSLPLVFPPTEQSILDNMFRLPVADRLNFGPAPISPPICNNVTLIDDDILEQVDTKSFRLDLSHPDAVVTFTPPQTAQVVITDDDSVTIVVDESSRNMSVTEGETASVCARTIGRADFVISASFQPLTVPGSAMADDDFAMEAHQLSFPPNSAEPQCVSVEATDNNVLERNEEFWVMLALTQGQNSKISLGAQTTANVTIIDDDFVEVGFEAAEYSIIEGNGEIEICGVLSGRQDIPVSITFSILDPPERDQSNPDYIPVPSFAFFEGVSTASSRRECVRIEITNDTLLEDTESFNVELASSDSAVRITQGVSTVYIIDDDQVRVGLKERRTTVAEDSQYVPVCVDLVGRTQEAIEVVLETRPNTARAGADYGSVLTTLTFNMADSMVQEMCVNISVVEDSIFEEDEKFSISLQVVRSAVSIHINESIITIQDNDGVSLSFAAEEATTSEGAGVWQACVQLSGRTEKAVPYQVAVMPSEAVLGADYQFVAPVTPSFLPGSQQRQCHPVTIEDDSILENTEHFEALLTVEAARVSVLTSRARVAITDNDFVSVGFNQTEFTVNEDDPEQVQVCVELTGEIERDVSVSIVGEPGSADGEDYVAIDEVIAFVPEANRTHCISVHVPMDMIVEGTESFSLLLSSSDSAVRISPSVSTVSILDDDQVRVGLTEGAVTVAEDGQYVPVCVEMMGRTQEGIEVVLETQSDTAQAGADYASVSTTLTFNMADSMVQEMCVNISVVDDSVFEGEESFRVSLRSAHSAVVVLTGDSIITIQDNDQVTLSLDVEEAAVSEGVGVWEACVLLSGSTEKTIPYQLQLLPMEAVLGTDYQFVAPVTPSFLPGSQQRQCHPVTIEDDSILENTEHFEALLTVEAARVSVLTSRARVAITDNDFVSVGFNQTEFTVNEDDPEQVQVCVELTGEIERDVSVSIVGEPGSADGEDYVAIDEVIAFVPEANRTHCISVHVPMDMIVEGTESFSLLLSSSDSAVRISPSVSTVSILDDDQVRVGLTEGAVTVAEDGQYVPVCVEMMGRTQEDIEVVLETQSDTAQAEADYGSVSTTLTFNMADNMVQEMCVNISVVEDSVFEGEESFRVSLRSAHSAVVVLTGESIITIQDNDQVTLSLDVEEAAVSEGVGVWEACVLLSGSTEKTIPYQLQLLPMEAVLGADYQFVAPLAPSFPPGSQQRQCHPVTIEDDSILENTEHFEALLTVEAAGVSVLTSRARVAITDNDFVSVGFNQTEFTVDEDDPVQRRTSVCIMMAGELGKEITVSVASQTGTASADDFDTVTGDITFAPGADSTQCFDVNVRPDKIVERPEQFSVLLSSNSDRVTITLGRALFTIIDNDVVCLPSSLDTSRGYFSWPETFSEEFATTECERGMATRFCSSTGVWGKPVTGDCYVSTNELFRYIERHGFTEDNFRELRFAVNQLMTENEDANERYARIVRQILREFMEEVDANLRQVDSEIFVVLLEIMNGIQTWPRPALEQHSSSIVDHFEKLTLSLFKEEGFDTLSKFKNRFSFHSDKAKISELFSQDQPDLKYFFTRNSAGDIEIITKGRITDYEASITFPKSISDRLTGRGQVEAVLFLSYYDPAALFPVKQNTTQEDPATILEVPSVVAATFAREELQNLEDDVIITFKLNMQGRTSTARMGESEPTANLTCVSWDFSANEGRGNWVDDGCELISYEGGEATCACSHLTNYAILVETSAIHEPIAPRVVDTLSILSIVGVCISILGLTFTIATLLLFGKLRKRDNTKFRVQLCLAMILMLVFFAIGIYQVETFEICVVASGLLHYFTLVSAMWMAADALLMLLKLTLIISHPRLCFTVTISLLCWLLPIPVVAAPIVIDRDFAISYEYCFISHTLVLFASLLGPIAALLVITLVIFLIATCVIIGYSAKRFKGSKKASKRRGACRSIFGTLGVMLLFGLAWVFGAFTIRGGPDYFKYLFVGFTSLQGLFVFVFFVIFAKETQDLWLQTCGCKERKKREKLLTAITGIAPRKRDRLGLDENADRLKPLEEDSVEVRLGMSTFDVTYAVQPTQFDILLHSDRISEVEESTLPRTREEPSEREREGTSDEEEMTEKEALERQFGFISVSELGIQREEQTSRCLLHGSSLLTEGSLYSSAIGNSPGHSSTHSVDSAQNTDVMSTADSGILMDKGKNSPTHELQHPQSGSTPRHSHSVSGIGYISAESSMETLPQREEDCFKHKGEPITLAPSLRPRAIPNEYATINVDNPCL